MPGRPSRRNKIHPQCQAAVDTAVAELTAEIARLRGQLEAATTCADLLVRIVRPMYSGPSGDQGVNDPLYGECLSAIRRYKQSRQVESPT